MTDITLHLGDCLEIMKDIPDGSVDAIITDPPYGTTACKWDTVIPFAPMLEQLKRIAKPKAAIVLFSSQPFTSALVMSNPAEYKYEWVWIKNVGSNFLNCKREPMKEHESILVFYSHNYYPQRIERKDKERAKYPYKADKRSGSNKAFGNIDFGVRIEDDINTRVPSSVLRYNRQTGYHPTQKPVAMLEYLIRTYTNEGDTVLDFTMGSGTTGVACHLTGRNFIGIEIDPDYYKIAERRIREAQMQPLLPLEVCA